MDHFDFGVNRMAAVLVDVGRAKLPDGSWLYEVINKHLMRRTRDEARSCLIHMSQMFPAPPRSVSESTYQIDSFKQKGVDYIIADQIKSAAKTLGESNEDHEKHLILISRNFDESYEAAFKWIKSKDYDIKTKIIGIGKDTELLQLLADEHGFGFAKVDRIDAVQGAIMGIGE